MAGNDGKYLLCEYCGNMFPRACSPNQKRHDDEDGCPNTDDSCFTCNSSTNTISNKQKNSRDWKARCIVCVSDNVWARHKRMLSNEMARTTPIALFHDAVSYGEIDEVSKWLKSGIDPNGKRQLWEKDEKTGAYLPVWNADGSVYEETDDHQPNTPLKCVVFVISNCLLTDKDMENLKAVAQLLIDAGAAQEEAIEYAKSRYGGDCFTDDHDDDVGFREAMRVIGHVQPKQSDYTEVIPGVYVGSVAAVKDLVSRGLVKRVVNCADELRNVGQVEDSSYLKVPLDDSGSLKDQVVFADKVKAIVKFLDQESFDTSPVLIHCQMGVSRSPSVMVAYLVHSGRHTTVASAKDFIKHLRPVAFSGQSAHTYSTALVELFDF